MDRTIEVFRLQSTTYELVGTWGGEDEGPFALEPFLPDLALIDSEPESSSSLYVLLNNLPHTSDGTRGGSGEAGGL